MSDYVLRIEKLENGYEVEICDPKIMESNNKPKSNWQDPWKSYAFESVEGVTKFVTEHLDKLSPPPDADVQYSKAFEQAASEEE